MAAPCRCARREATIGRAEPQDRPAAGRPPTPHAAPCASVRRLATVPWPRPPPRRPPPGRPPPRPSPPNTGAPCPGRPGRASPTSHPATVRRRGPIGANPSMSHGVHAHASSTGFSTGCRSSTATSPTPTPSSTATRSTPMPPARPRRPTRRRPTSPSSPSPAPRASPATTWATRCPTLPTWTVAGYQWAPSVWERPDGTFVMYYSTPATQPLDCVYKATNPGCVDDDTRAQHRHVHLPGHQHQPLGAFRRRLELSLHLPDGTGRAQSTPASSSTTERHALALVEGRRRLLQPADAHLLPAALTRRPPTVGPPHELIGATQAWEGGLVEAPSMVQSGKTFWMFYSANLWGTPSYSIGIADCRFGDGTVHQAARPGLAHQHEQCQRPGLRRVGVLRGRRGTHLDGASRSRAGTVGQLRRTAPLCRSDGLPGPRVCRRSRPARPRRHWPRKRSTTRTRTSPSSPRPPTST